MSDELVTKESIAQQLDGVEYPLMDAVSDAAKAAKAAGLVIVHGDSDDIMTFEGAFRDEADVYEGGTALLDCKGVLNRDSVDDTDDDAIHDFVVRKKAARSIKAIWGDGDISWRYETDIPHATFNVMEDGEVYCVGIVFALADLAPALQQQGEAATPAARWRVNGEPDPHAAMYDGERSSLSGGDMTDDEVANAVYLDPSVVNLTIAKERIRWLSRKLFTHPPKPVDQQAGDRIAIRLLIAAGFITDEKANEALNIAHGFSDDTLAPAPKPVVSDAMVDLAINAWCDIADVSEWRVHNTRDAIKAALEAALGVKS